MKRFTLIPLLLIVLMTGFSWAASTVDDTVPATSSAAASSPIRTNFVRIKSEISALQAQHPISTANRLAAFSNTSGTLMDSTCGLSGTGQPFMGLTCSSQDMNPGLSITQSGTGKVAEFQNGVSRGNRGLSIASTGAVTITTQDQAVPLSINQTSGQSTQQLAYFGLSSNPRFSLLGDGSITTPLFSTWGPDTANKESGLDYYAFWTGPESLAPVTVTMDSIYDNTSIASFLRLNNVSFDFSDLSTYWPTLIGVNAILNPISPSVNKTAWKSSLIAGRFSLNIPAEAKIFTDTTAIRAGVESRIEFPSASTTTSNWTGSTFAGVGVAAFKGGFYGNGTNRTGGNGLTTYGVLLSGSTTDPLANTTILIDDRFAGFAVAPLTGTNGDAWYKPFYIAGAGNTTETYGRSYHEPKLSVGCAPDWDAGNGIAEVLAWCDNDAWFSVGRYQDSGMSKSENISYFSSSSSTNSISYTSTVLAAKASENWAGTTVALKGTVGKNTLQNYNSADPECQSPSGTCYALLAQGGSIRHESRFSRASITSTVTETVVEATSPSATLTLAMPENKIIKAVTIRYFEVQTGAPHWKAGITGNDDLFGNDLMASSSVTPATYTENWIPTMYKTNDATEIILTPMTGSFATGTKFAIAVFTEAFTAPTIAQTTF